MALLTLFHDDGSLDEAASARLAGDIVDAGVTAVVVAGSTGEASALDGAERVRLLEAVVAAVGERAAVVAGTGADTTPQAAAFTADAVAHGADAVLTLSPPGAADPRHYYDEVARSAAGRPVLAYHWPAKSAPGIALDVLDSLPVAGIKDSTGDPERLLAQVTGFEGAVYTGSPAILLQAGLVGAAGAILGLANVEPALCIGAFRGDADAQIRLAPFIAEARESFPGSLKRMAAERHGTSTRARLG